MNELWQRLKQHKLVQWAVAYLAGGWALLQVLDVAGDSYGWPSLVMRIAFALIALGFGLTLVLAWYHGERGQQKVTGVELLVLSAVLALGGGLIWSYGGITQSAPVTASSVAAPPTIAAQAITSTIPEKSIAVLPLSNESGNDDQQYFSDGLSEDFITALSQFDGLKVIGRNSAFQFRDSTDSAQTIGAKLGVAHLLEGSVRRQGDMVRISAALIRTADASTLWSHRYDRPYKDLFALQDEVTHAVASALHTKLLDSGGAMAQSDRPPSGSLTAYTAYLQGKFYYARSTEADWHKAIAQNQIAIKDDPRYALAYSALSYTWVSVAAQYLSGPAAQQAYVSARAAANTALTLDPNLAAAHKARGNLLLNADFDWTGAQAEFQRAVQLAPNDASSLFNLANLKATLGHPEQAITLTQRVLEIDPLHTSRYTFLATYLSGLSRLDEAEVVLRKAIELRPTAEGYHQQLSIIEIQRGDAQAALAAARQEPPGIWQDIALALAWQIGTDRATADAVMQNLVDKWADAAPYQIAEVYALRRDPDNMFKWLDRSWKSRDPGISNLLFDPFILRYQHDSRFAALCDALGLPTTTTAKAMP